MYDGKIESMKKSVLMAHSIGVASRNLFASIAF